MYKLTLTRSERMAIDWVGDRDWNGDELSRCLLGSFANPDQEWGDDGDMTFFIPEHDAWDMLALYEDNRRLIPHFSSEFRAKLEDFFKGIT